jgi:hypothetical protein
MPSSTDVLKNLWAVAGGDPLALNAIKLTGEGPLLPSSFAIDQAGQVTIAAAGLAAAEIWKLRSGEAQDVAVDLEHAAVECRSERYLRLDGKPPPPVWDAIAGVYKVRDGFVRLHTNFRHHRDNVCNVLGCEPERETVQAALNNWNGEDFETKAYAGGCVVSFMRPHEVWSRHPHARALAELPVLTIEKIGEAPPKPWSNGDRPLSGVRVLDLSRVIAGPVAGRTLAAHGADVLLVAGPTLPQIDWLTIDNGRGKLSTLIELKSEAGRAALRSLLAEADIFSQGFRPDSLAALGFSAAEAAKLNPGIVFVSMCAYGHEGRWAGRRGFDSLVQTTTGFNHAEGVAAGVDGPKELPSQMLDHATGYLMAFGAMMAKARQAREGGSWHVRVSLAQTGRWLWNLGRIDGAMKKPDLAPEAIAKYMQKMPSGFGELSAVRHAALLSKTPARWTRPAMPLGSHAAEWPARS